MLPCATTGRVPNTHLPCSTIPLSQPGARPFERPASFKNHKQGARARRRRRRIITSLAVRASIRRHQQQQWTRAAETRPRTCSSAARSWGRPCCSRPRAAASVAAGPRAWRAGASCPARCAGAASGLTTPLASSLASLPSSSRCVFVPVCRAKKCAHVVHQVGLLFCARKG